MECQDTSSGQPHILASADLFYYIFIVVHQSFRDENVQAKAIIKFDNFFFFFFFFNFFNFALMSEFNVAGK